MQKYEVEKNKFDVYTMLNGVVGEDFHWFPCKLRQFFFKIESKMSNIKTLNRAEIANQSLTNILNLIRKEVTITRQNIEQFSELGRTVVTSRLNKLNELNLIEENKLGITSGGRAPKLVEFQKSAGLILVANLDQTAIGAGIADLAGNLIMEHHEAIDLTAPPNETIKRLIRLFNWLLEKHGQTDAVWGISISAPSPIPDINDELFLSKTPIFLPGWEEALIVEKLISHFGVPVWLRSGVELMTMGELKAGAGKNLKDMLLIKIGQRISAGLIFNGELYRGATGAAGLIGQLPVNVGEQYLPLEMVAGAENIKRLGHQAVKDDESQYLSDILKRNDQLTSTDIGQAAMAGDVKSIDIISNAGRLIGHGIASITSLLNPTLIVLSGDLATTNDVLLAAVREIVYKESHPLVTRDLKIQRSQMGNSAGLVGAALVAVESLFSSEILKEWILLGKPSEHFAFKETLLQVNLNLKKTATKKSLSI